MPERDLLQDMFDAAKSGNEAALLAILVMDTCPSVNVTNTDWTLLHYAAANNWLNVAEKLLKRGADVKALEHHKNPFKRERSPVDIAIEEKNWQMAHMLVEKLNESVDMNAVLFQFVHYGPDDDLFVQEAVLGLVERGASADYRPASKSDTVLHAAVEGNKINLVNILIKQGVDALRHGEGTPKATIAIVAGSKMGGASKSQVDVTRRTSPIVLAAKKGHWDIFDSLFSTIDFSKNPPPFIDSYQIHILSEALRNLISDDAGFSRIEHMLRLGAYIRPVAASPKALVDKQPLGNLIHRLHGEILQHRLNESVTADSADAADADTAVGPSSNKMTSFNLGVTPLPPKKSRRRASAGGGGALFSGDDGEQPEQEALSPQHLEERSCAGVKSAEIFLQALIRSGAALIVSSREFMYLVEAACRSEENLLPILERDLTSRKFQDENDPVNSKQKILDIFAEIKTIKDCDAKLARISEKYESSKKESHQAKSTVLLTLYGRLRVTQKLMKNNSPEKWQVEKIRNFLALLLWGQQRNKEEILLTGQESLLAQASSGATSRLGSVIVELCRVFRVDPSFVNAFVAERRVYSILHRSALDAFMQNHLDVIYNNKQRPAVVIGDVIRNNFSEEIAQLRQAVHAMEEVSLPTLAQIRILFDKVDGYQPIRDVVFIPMIPDSFIKKYIKYCVEKANLALLDELRTAVTIKMQNEHLQQMYAVAEVTIMLTNLQIKYQQQPKSGNAVKREVCDKLVDLLFRREYKQIKAEVQGLGEKPEEWAKATQGDPSTLGLCLDKLRDLIRDNTLDTLAKRRAAEPVAAEVTLNPM